MTEMKIRDEEIETLSNNIMDLATQIDSRIQTLIEALTNVCLSGVSEGDFHNNLCQMSYQVGLRNVRIE